MDNRILNQVLIFNNEEFIRVLNNYFITILRDFKANYSLFKFANDLVYLEVLKKVFDIIEKIYNEEDLRLLFEIEALWNDFIVDEKVGKVFEDMKPTICEKYLKNKKTTLKNSIVINQFLFLQKFLGIPEGKKFIKTVIHSEK